MFSRVVSNFRKKSRSARRALQFPITEPEIKTNPWENQCGRNFSLEFNAVETIGSPLSAYESDSDCSQKEAKSHLPSVDKEVATDSGALRLLVINR
jgi:hypothetical protein